MTRLNPLRISTDEELKSQLPDIGPIYAADTEHGVPGRRTRGDWAIDSMRSTWRELCVFADQSTSPLKSVREEHEREIDIESFATIEVTAAQYERMKRRSMACAEALKLAETALNLAQDRDLARIDALRFCDDVLNGRKERYSS